MTVTHGSYSNKTGLPPGSLVYVGRKKEGKGTISVIDFTEEKLNEEILENIEDCNYWNNDKSTTWIRIEGVHDTDLIESVGNFFKLDHLVLEDVVNTNQRPGAEEFDDFLFFTIKLILLGKKGITMEQFSLVLGKSWLITFHESKVDIFDSFLNRIRQSKGSIRQRKSDFIFYRIIDTIVDHYFLVIESISEELEALEEKIISNPDDDIHHEIYDLKKKIVATKKAIMPLRDAVAKIIKSDEEFISEYTQKYLRDVYEHVIQVIDNVDSQRETISDFLNLYMSGMSNKMNQVMKVLTIFASIFIPLTFIAGIYGMNFEIMPELGWKYGYLATWGVMITVAAVLLIYFRRKKWL